MTPLTSQRSLFDARESERRKVAGMARAASAHGEWLEEVREVAVYLCKELGQCSADDLRLYGVKEPRDAHPNVWGAVFVDSRFVFAGYTHSKRPEAHSNLIRLWRLALPTNPPRRPSSEGDSAPGTKQGPRKGHVDSGPALHLFQGGERGRSKEIVDDDRGKGQTL